MRKYVQTTLFFAMLWACVPAFASTATDFYRELLRRGTSEVDAGRHDTAITPLRLAAFGLVDSIEHYETAQVYLAVAFDKLGQQEEARRASLRVVTAEGIERKFASLALPASIRAAFMNVARKVLSPADASSLTGTGQTSSAPRPDAAPVVPVTPPATQSQASTAPAPRPVVPPQTQSSQPARPQQATPQQEPPRNDPPKVADAPKVVEAPKPAPQTPVRTDPPKTVVATPPAQTPAVQTPAAPKPQTSQTAKPQQAAPPPQSTPPQQSAQPQPARIDVPSRITAGERALGAANLVEARRVYREVLTVTSLDRPTLIRVGEGLYRARDFAPALTAFRRLGTLRTGEEAYRYYIAVALYETGDIAAAKRELTAALPYIEITPDVQRYRAKIEGARN